MAMNWTTSPGGLFNRLGAIFKTIKDLRTYQNTTLAAREAVITDLYHTPATPVRHLKYLTESPATLFPRWKSQCDPVTASLLAQARKTILEQVHAEDPLPIKDDEHALDKLIYLMYNDGQDIENQLVTLPTRGLATAGSSNLGNAQIAAAPTSATTSVSAYLIWAAGMPLADRSAKSETIEFQCTGEQDSSGIVSVAGEVVVPIGTYGWPGGSGIGTSLRVPDLSVDGSGEEGPGNTVLTNGDFEDFTANLPTGWTATAGVAGTDFAQTTTGGEYYAGSSGLKFIGTAASIAPRLKQTFGAAASPGTVKDRTFYFIGMWIKGSSAAVGTGNFQVVVTINGSAITSSISMSSGFPTSWTFYPFLIVNTAEAVLSTDNIEVGVASGADLTNGQFVYVDSVSLVEAVYHGGLLLAAFPGTTQIRYGDRWTLAVTNDRTAEMGFYLDMAYDLTERRLMIPFDLSSPTIADSLIA